MIPIDMTNQKSGSPGHIARMSRPIMSTIITGAIPAIIMFIDTSSGMKLRRTFSVYDPPITARMKSAWKMRSPKRKPAMYSISRSAHIGSPSRAVMIAARMIPVASPATQ